MENSGNQMTTKVLKTGINNIKRAIILIFAAIPLLAFSQTGTIKGKVTEKENGKIIPVPFANVFIAGSSTGATTDLDGNYSFNVSPGNYKIVTTYVGFVPDTANNITITAGNTRLHNVTISQNVKELKMFDITATKVTQTEQAVLMEIRQSDQIVSGISSQQIQKSNDREASQVMRRIPGVTVIGDRFIMIRGLQERYNSVMLHNTYAPSMEADVRSFSFDILPSSLLDRVLIYKTPSAELPGDFAGGVVKIFTRSIPDENSTTVNYMTSFRNGTTFNHFHRPEQGAKHWMGFNDGYNDLPGSFPNDLRKIPQNDSDKLTVAGRALRNDWQPERINAGLDQRFSITKASRMKWGKVEVGNITAINYSSSKVLNSVTRYDYNIYDTINDKSDPIYEFYDAQNTQNIRVGILHNWAFRFNPKHQIEIKTLLNQNSTSEYIHRTGTAYEFNYVPSNHSFMQQYRGIFSGQLTGQHEINKDRTSVDWVLGYGKSHLTTPDYKRYRSDVDTTTGKSTLYVPAGAAASFFLGRFYSEMEETSQTAAININHKVKFSGLPDFVPVLSTGVFFENKARYFSARNIGYTRASTFNFDNDLLNHSIDSLFHPDNINGSTGIRIDEQSNPSDNYTAANVILAPYVAALVPLTKKIKLKAGVRFENNLQELNSATLTGTPVVVSNPVLSVLPSANISYNITEKTLVRAAYGMTVNRPEFRELAPFGFYDFSFNLVKKGNENLQSATIHNYDLRYEFYPSANEVISVAAFYKKFLNPIENFFVPGGGSGGIKTFTFGNAVEAYSAGAEIEIRKSLAGLTKSKFIDDLNLLFNGAYIHSRVNLGDDLRQSNNRPLMGQSPYIVNSGIYYFNVKREVQVTLLYNIIGKRLFIIGTDDYPDIYEMPRNVFDLTVSKKIGKRIEVKVGITDIL
ncbi:MAG: carboxypeptidase-like regulatory domain-containing protein, partial [Bacteroidetes bacterium]|nr:carboxypeptidase-like regulatory domain-containing protein [Bacteroidota bacterium]